MIAPGVLHVAAAAVALLAGAFLFASRKGTRRHRRLGYLYLAAMTNLNLAAWAVDTGGAIGPFHYLTLLSLATLIGAYAIIVTGRSGPGRSEAHGIMMAWSYAGAISAGLGQASVLAELPVGGVIGVSLAIAGLVIHVVRPRALRMSGSVA